MSKPTLLQTLLGRPSQSYSFPQEKDYHSTKSHMRRAAAEAQQAARPKTDDPSRNSGVTSTLGRTDELMGRTQVRELNESVIIHSSFINRSQHLDTDKNVISGPGNVQNDDEDGVQDGEGDQDYSSQEESEDNDDDDDDNDIFYTPNTTPRSSMAGSNLVYPTPMRKRVLNEPLASSFTPLDARSTTSSSTATSDTHSIFSTDSAPVSDSTRITTPYNSESGHDAEVKPTARRQHEQQQRQQHAASSQSRREAVTRVNTERVKRNSSSYTDEDWAKDVRWLVSPDTSQKSDSSAKSKKRRSTSGSSSVSSSSLTSTPSSPSSSSHHSLPPSSHHVTPVRNSNQPTTTKTYTKQKKKSVHAHNPGIMMSMAALLEEDEDAYIIKNSARGRTTSSPDTTTEGGDLARSNTSKSTLSNTRKQSVASNAKPHLVRRRSRSLEDIGKRNSLLRDDLDDVSSQSSAFASSRGNLGPYAPSLPSHGTPGYTSLTLPRAPPPAFAQGVSSNKRASILGDVIGVGIGEGKVDLTRSGMAQTTMASVEVVKGLGSVSASGSLRNPFAFLGFRKQVQQLSAEDPSRRKQSSLGFTSWRKPPNYVPGNSVLVQVWAVGVDGVDVRLAGVSLGRGSGGERTASADPRSNLGLGQGKRGASESEIHRGGESRNSTKPGFPRSASTSVGKTSIKPWHRRGNSNGSLPSSTTVKTVKVSKSGSGGSSKAKIEPPEVGYIPGRSFIGRVLEVGWEVNEDAIRKGEWVVGLLDVRKCGALQEFIVVDRHKVYRVPHPTIPSSNALVDPTDSDQYMTLSQKGKASSPAALVTLASLTLNQPQHQPSSLSRYPIPTPFATSPSTSSSSPVNSRSVSPSPSRSNSLGASKPKLNFNLKLNSPPPPPTLQELALIPLCGVPAYRAVRTLLNAFASSSSPSSSSDPSHSSSYSTAHPYSYSSPLMYNWTLDQLNGDQRRRRALVLRGHDGIGSMAVQMLVRKGWRVCVHAPVPVYIVGSGSGNGSTTGESSEAEQKYMAAIEDRMRRWGAEEVIFDDGMSGGYHHHHENSSEDHADLNGVIMHNNGDEDDEGRGAIVRVIERLIGDGDVFDAVLDTVGGKEIWEASERLLRNTGSGLEGAAVPSAEGVRGLGVKDVKEKGLGRIGSIRKKDRDKEKEKEKEKERREREKKNAEQNHRAEKGRGQFTTLFGDTPSRVIPTAGDHFRAGLRSMKNNHKEEEEDVKGNGKGKTKGHAGKPGYAWVSIAQDVDWDGEDVRETIGTVMKMALNEGVRPWVGDLNRVVPFERTPDLFVEGGPLVDGGTAVVKIVE